MNTKQTIEKFFEDTEFLVRGKSYHSELPPIVRDWYCYTTDGGHSILCLIEDRFDYQDSNLWQSLCPVPVKTVLRSNRIYAGFVVVRAKYDERVGLQTPPEDDEF